MWVIVSTSKADEKHPILGDKKYVVGRTACDIIINDPSVSRKQGVLMMAHYEANVVKSFITPSLTLEDFSKFGTFVNGESVKTKPGSMTTLKDGDRIQFGGSPASVFVARYEPFVATTSCLEKVPKKNLQRVMCLLGGHVVRDWRASCDLLIMAKINVTIKVICAINNQKPIVTPDYLDHFHQYLMGQRDEKPDSKDYLPEVADKEVPAGVSFHPDIRRATLLKDLKFYFLSAHQFNKTNLAVSTAGGLPILLEDGAEEDADIMAQDGTIVVAVTRDVLSTLSPTCQKFVRTVCVVLKKKNLRMVTDPEIGWAILTCNTDDFCNPKSAITPSMYSSMASQSLSQMTDMDDNMQQHVSNTLLAATQHGAQQLQQQHQASTGNDSTQHQQQKTVGGRAGKRSANAMESERDDTELSEDRAKTKNSLPSLQAGSADKRIKREPPQASELESQQSLFGGGTEVDAAVKGGDSRMYSAPLFKSPQTPVVSSNRSRAISVDNETNRRTKKGEINDESQWNKEKKGCDDETNKSVKKSSSSLSLKEEPTRVRSRSTRKKVSGDADESRVAIEIDGDGGGDNEKIDSCVDDDNKNGKSSTKNGSKQVENLPSPINDNDSDDDIISSLRNNSTHANVLSSTEVEATDKNVSSSSSPCKFLNTKVNTKHNCISMEEVGTSTSNSEKESASPSVSTASATKRKRKKRQLFGGSSDEEEDLVYSGATSSTPSQKKSKSNNSNNGDTRNNRDCKEDSYVVVAESDFPSSSVICNGDTKVDPAVVKQECNSSNGGSDHRRGSGSSLASWATVKKEENGAQEGLSEEKKVKMDLVMDSNGQPLRHLCQVKVVDLIARAPGSRAGMTTPHSQQPTGVKNFKRFKKTVHCGSTGLPTIIGGRDLEPHKGTRLNQIDELLRESESNTQNGVGDKDAMFGWREEEVVGKKRTKRN